MYIWLPNYKLLQIIFFIAHHIVIHLYSTIELDCVTSVPYILYSIISGSLSLIFVLFMNTTKQHNYTIK